MTAWYPSSPDPATPTGEKWATNDPASIPNGGTLAIGRGVESDVARDIGAAPSLRAAVVETDSASRIYGDTDVNYYDELIISSGPIAYYRMGESTGTTLIDSSGYKRNGTYSAGVTLGSDGLVLEDPDKAAYFTGATTTSVATITNAAWQLVNNITVEAIITPGSSNTGVIISRMDYGYSFGPRYAWSLSVIAGQIRAFVFADNSSTNRIDLRGGVIQVGKTYHVAFSFSGTEVKLFVNGQQASSGALVGSLTTGVEPIRIGRTGEASTEKFIGVVDEVAVYDRALADEEISRHAFAASYGIDAEVYSAQVVEEFEDALILEAVRVEMGIPTDNETVASPEILVAYPVGVAIEDEEALVAFIPSLTDTRNRVGGRVRQSYATYSWTPPVGRPPAGVDIAVQYDTLNVFNNVSYPTVDSQPVYDVTTVRKKRAFDRILIGNKDITWWRGAATPMPDYQLIEPTLYGPASMDIPQVAAAFEAPGKGALSFMRKGARVEVQRVDEDGNVLGTDYKGFITAYRISGGDLSLDIGGQLSGRAALQNRQVPLFKIYKDIGWFMYHAVRGNAPMEPRLGPTTGIMAYSFGGMGLADYINELCALGQQTDGTVWSLMPDSEGVYRFLPKDKTTIHGTVYFDDARMKPDMNQDIAEEPNRIYATGVTAAGTKIKFGVYPGYIQGAPPPYPYNNNRTFGQGTTDSDTDTGDGISVMLNKLAVHKYLDYSSAGYPGGYDRDVTQAIKRLQRDAGITVTGDVNPKTWRSLYDQDATGYSLNWSHIDPAAQKSYTRRWYRTGSGAVRKKNPNYDPTQLKVDINIDVGSGYTRGQIRDFAEVELRPEDNWLGSVDSKLAVVRGEHNPGEEVTPADVMSLREVKPGMNLWAPLWDGGTLFHVSGASVGDQGRSVSLVLDTQFRDTTKVWQIIQRNFETRQNPSRMWIDSHRRSQMTNDTMITWDEIGGVLDGSIKLKAESWTVFPVLAGQEGTIQRLKIRTNPNAEFCTAMFGYKINPKKLERLIGNPLTKEGALNWQDPVILNRLDEENILIYIAGNQEAPCGYYPYDKQDGGTRTGVWEDDSGIAYRTFKHPMLYVAVWSDRECVVPAGRILWPQQEEGS